MNIIQAIDDPALFAPWFRDKATWAGWRTFLAVLFGLPMTPDQLAFYGQCTGRTEAPAELVEEAWLICGRRAGKSFVLALIAVFCFDVALSRRNAEFLIDHERAAGIIAETNEFGHERKSVFECVLERRGHAGELAVFFCVVPDLARRSFSARLVNEQLQPHSLHLLL